MIAIATAVDPAYLKKLHWTLPTWSLKKQLREARLYVFYHGFADPEKSLGWIREYWPDDKTQFVAWSMPQAKTHREEMLSAFVLGAAQHIAEDYYIKLDADTYVTDPEPDDLFDAEDMEYDLCAHRWGYTKPGWWVDKMMAWMAGKEYTGGEGDTGSRGAKRIISWCSGHRMEFVRRASQAAHKRSGGSLPIPSHDSYLWHLADHADDCNWRRLNLKERGVGHCSRWKSIREQICSHPSAWNPYLNRELLKHIQIEITTACNLACPNCDRNCGTAPSSEKMTVEQVEKFMEQSIDAGKRWDRIDIIGGEPLLHPELTTILHMAHQCGRKIRLTTNGILSDRLKDIPDWVDVRNSAKDKSRDNKFEAVNIAPKDRGIPDDEVLACSIPWRCGLALSRYGYFPCGAGASIARCFGMDIGIKSLADVTPSAIRYQMEQLCRLCGHSRSIAKTTTKQESSKAWRWAFRKYKKLAEKMTLY